MEGQIIEVGWNKDLTDPNSSWDTLVGLVVLGTEGSGTVFSGVGHLTELPEENPNPITEERFDFFGDMLASMAEDAVQMTGSLQDAPRSIWEQLGRGFSNMAVTQVSSFESEGDPEDEITDVLEDYADRLDSSFIIEIDPEEEPDAA